MDFILNIVIQIVLSVSNFFSSLPNSLIKVPAPSPLSIVVFYLTVIFFFTSLKYLFKKRILNISFAVFALMLACFYITFPGNTSEVIFFDVGNGDNCLIKTKNGKYILIDTGRKVYNGASTAKTVTLEYFYDHKIKNIDTLVVTHYDSDHSGGLVDILKEVKVKNIVTSEPVCTSQISCDIKKYFEKENIKYLTPKNGQIFEVDEGVRLVNYLPNPKIKDKRNKNEFSTVSLLNVEGFKFLFMADAGINAYKDIEKYLPADIDVLKSAHHGANNTVNEEMLNKLKPKYSILLTGRNTYGHPSKDTVNLLSKYSTVLSTNDLGAIKFKINPKDETMKVYHFNGDVNRWQTSL